VRLVLLGRTLDFCAEALRFKAGHPVGGGCHNVLEAYYVANRPMYLIYRLRFFLESTTGTVFVTGLIIFLQVFKYLRNMTIPPSHPAKQYLVSETAPINAVK
jgi:hypothetical protein